MITSYIRFSKRVQLLLIRVNGFMFKMKLFKRRILVRIILLGFSEVQRGVSYSLSLTLIVKAIDVP